MRKRKGFTLIELLVVIAIIALLLSIVMPALRAVKGKARRIQCAANLHQWGLAWQAYATSNDEQLAETYEIGGGGRYPANYHVSHRSQVSYESIMAVMPGANINTSLRNSEIADVWVCPSNRKLDEFNEFVNKGATSPWKFFMGMYSYFGRVDAWKDSASRPNDLTGKNLSSQKLLMADILYRWMDQGNNQGYWAYNHSDNGGSLHDPEFNLEGEEAPIQGINQLFGDMSTRWKTGNKFDIQLMNIPDRDSIGCVRGGGSDVTYY